MASIKKGLHKKSTTPVTISMSPVRLISFQLFVDGEDTVSVFEIGFIGGCE